MTISQQLHKNLRQPITQNSLCVSTTNQIHMTFKNKSCYVICIYVIDKRAKSDVSHLWIYSFCCWYFIQSYRFVAILFIRAILNIRMNREANFEFFFCLKSGKSSISDIWSEPNREHNRFISCYVQQLSPVIRKSLIIHSNGSQPYHLVGSYADNSDGWIWNAIGLLNRFLENTECWCSRYQRHATTFLNEMH